MMLTDRIGVQGGVDLRWHGNLAQNEGLAGTGIYAGARGRGDFTGVHTAPGTSPEAGTVRLKWK